MTDKIKLEAQKRTLFGKKVKKLRQQDLVPANIFGKNLESVAISVPQLELKRIYRQAGETSVISLSLGDEKQTRPVLISNIQLGPIDKKVLHVDFRQVDLTQKITANVPVELVGESDAVTQGAILVTLKNEIEVEALPNDIPDKIQLDITSLNQIGDSLTVADIKLDQNKVKITLEAEEVIVLIQEPTQEPVEPEPVSEEVAEEGETVKPATDSEKESAPAPSSPDDNQPKENK